MSREHWWTWFISGWKDRRLISAKALNGEPPEYVAELFRRDGVERVVVKGQAEG